MNYVTIIFYGISRPRFMQILYIPNSFCLVYLIKPIHSYLNIDTFYEGIFGIHISCTYLLIDAIHYY